jgi:phytoene/squalene synthetase
MVAARAMEIAYHALHRKIKRRNYDVYRERIRLGPVEKASALIRFWIDNRKLSALSARERSS